MAVETRMHAVSVADRRHFVGQPIAGRVLKTPHVRGCTQVNPVLADEKPAEHVGLRLIQTLHQDSCLIGDPVSRSI